MQRIDDIPESGTVLARIDVNAPVEDGEVQDNARFARHAETVQRLVDDGHSVVLLAHQGRPGRDTYTSLKQHADILSDHLDREVAYQDSVHDQRAVDAVQQLTAGDVLLLENTRFSDDELVDHGIDGHADTDFVEQLSAVCDYYLNDAYSAAHRPHASLVGFPQRMDAYAGDVLATEYEHNTAIHTHLDGDTVMVLGGKKPEDVLHVMDALIDRVDDFLVGGLVGELFLRAEGHDVGYDVDDSQFMHDQWLEHRDRLKKLLDEHRGKIHLPLDLAYHDPDRARTEVAVSDAAKREPYWDVGHDTVDRFTDIIQDADAVFVKGALGVFEDPKFKYGTEQLIRIIAATDCYSVIGGGDTSRIIDMYDLDRESHDHVSTAGGAYIHALAGDELPAVKALHKTT